MRTADMRILSTVREQSDYSQPHTVTGTEALNLSQMRQRRGCSSPPAEEAVPARADEAAEVAEGEALRTAGVVVGAGNPEIAVRTSQRQSEVQATIRRWILRG